MITAQAARELVQQSDVVLKKRGAPGGENGDRFWAIWDQDVFTLHRLSQDQRQWCIRWRKHDGFRKSADQIDGFISKADITKGYINHPGFSFIKVKDDKHLLQLMLKS